LTVHFARYRSDDGTVGAGEIVDSCIRGIHGEVALADVVLLAPCKPTKVICVGLNYRDHAEEIGMSLPDEPILFLKPPSTVIGTGEAIIAPVEASRLDYEAELVVVIGRRARRTATDEAMSYVAGLTAGNDVTARNYQTPNSQWTRAKGYDTFAPIGPVLARDLDPSDLEVKCLVNGELRQRSNTDQMVFSPPELVSFASSIMTLEPGDVIMTGTPPGIGELHPGDRVEVNIEGIGRLLNEVISEDTEV
jgi:2-keto-4-pentenoate hydratase/2-oxohepta-3-ene-1,7-dioic acid hydratase in catechol pathway